MLSCSLANSFLRRNGINITILVALNDELYENPGIFSSMKLLKVYCSTNKKLTHRVKQAFYRELPNLQQTIIFLNIG